MLLKSMSLTNFRQFNGTQSVNFSVDPEKNVTVIMGENGSHTDPRPFFMIFSFILSSRFSFLTQMCFPAIAPSHPLKK